ncbi:CbiX/SirB N-terminal domain-containing protein [Cutibacterium granulosum]|uniref:CbiX/SirB N-terminal domain-containing protein n=1 Tax=Cutibacterium granulosum TaxID=33011 RepID=UPI002B225298|nr:CbiX/SirB N-terminal domain-containing protein [Cutibacterium granulosum]MEA5656408.1 CbiX/SirB N-terminal domain-containing protein [Cutibacterium granulosum]
MTDTKIASGTPLVIAAHGTRDESGVAECRALAERVANKLPDVPVELGFVELAEPKIPEAVQAAVAQAPGVSEEPTEGEQPVSAVVVPLMFNTGGHVREDIPEAIDEGRGGARVAYSAPLLPDVRMRKALDRRLAETLAAGEGREQWRARDTAVVLVGRGALVADANASHYTLTRMFWEENDLARVEPAFIQVTRPSVPEALTALHAQGAQQIVVQGNFLFPGLLHVWMTEQVQAWQASHPGVEIRVASVIGDCDEVAEVVVDRYREPLDEVGLGEGAPVYMSGLRLQGRTVLVVGAGHVAERRVARLLDAGADVHVVAPNSGIQLTRMARKGLVNLERRAFQNDDLDGVWFVQALTNDPQVNAKVTAEAEKRGIFCVRGDDGRKGSAFTPATQQAGGMTVSVVGDRTPRRSAKIRDEVLRALQG